MDLLGRRHQRAAPCLLGWSFNPCSHGFTRKTRQRTFFGSSCIAFQSLFSWIYSEDYSFAVPRRYGFDVSILVLMDLLGRLFIRRSPPLWIRCFNPCSHGFTRKTLKRVFGKLGLIQFQSLFSWIYSEDTPGICRCDRSVPVSILVLMDLLGRLLIVISASYQSVCFNPCSHGFTRKTLNESLFLLEWACFNPCSHGFTRKTMWYSRRTVHHRGFQSLFSWIYSEDSA